MAFLLDPCIRFGRWWAGELAALLPSPLRRAVIGQTSVLVLEVRDGNARFHSLQGERSLELGDCDLEAKKLPDGLAAKIKKAMAGPAGVVLALPRSSVTTKDGELPLAAAENLDEVIGFEMDRLTPFQQDEVYFHISVVGRDLEQQKLKVALTVSPRVAVDRFLDRMRAWNLHAGRVDVVSGTQSLLQGINLLPPVSKGASSIIRRAISVGLLAALIALSVMAISLPLDRKARFAEALSQEVLLARKKLGAVRNLTDEIQSLEKSNRYLIDLRQNTVLVSRVLDDVTRLLPDDTWLSQMRLIEDRLEVTGYSQDAAKLIAIFDGSALFTEPKFRSPVTRDQRSGVERFSLTLKLAEQGS
ncbi:PilN domain-containing protein [Pelagibius sp. Alg239-R121]|uniref:PilN domain-containing protein n=1 Tax=Pelagibius sp. Alg239-R121 TaxID=2993448 RepID=UPI0024A7417C|nr:PilN domain-containing protein [Pelagibius sp. Alg239-R121]